MKKNYIIKFMLVLSGIILLLVVCIIILYIKGNDYSVNTNSNICVIDKSIYYTDTRGHLLRYNIIDNSYTLLAEDFMLLSNNQNYLVGTYKTFLKLYNINCDTIQSFQNINTNNVAISNNDIYFINESDNKNIYSIRILNHNIKKILDIKSNNICSNNEYLFFEKDNDSIYKYDINNFSISPFFEGKYCFFFNCDEKFVYLSDYLSGGYIRKIDIQNEENEIIMHKSSSTFFVKDGFVYYVPFISEENFNKTKKFWIHKYHNNIDINMQKK